MITYSIIIPHKNSLDLLIRCVNSIPNRRDIEIIIVDDRSNSNNLPHNELFPDKNFVKIYFNSGTAGAGAARNIGLEKCSGERLIFADADDFFLENAFNYIDQSIDNNPLDDIIYYKVESRYSDTLNLADRDKFINSLIDQYSLSDKKMLLRLKHLVPWGKVFKIDFIRRYNIEFDEILVSNDIMFSVRAGFYASSISIFDKAIYCVTQNFGSLTNTISISNNRTRMLVAISYNNFLKANNLSKFSTSLRPYLLNAQKFGIIELIKCFVEIKKRGGDIFSNFNFIRSLKSLFKIRNIEKNKHKYIIRK